METSLAAITKQAIDAIGGPAAVGRLCGITLQAVTQWTQVPSPHVLKVAAASGIPRSKLRPDLYPEEAEPQAQPATTPGEAAA